MSFKDFSKDRQTLKTKAKDQSEVISLHPELLVEEYNQGVAIADPCHISHMESNFAWKRTFQNVWTGYPNDGKTQFTLFMMVIKSLKANWKWCVWSPEMKSANFQSGKVTVHYNDLINDIIWMLTGKTPHKHIAEKYNIERVGLEEYMSKFDWIKDHFVFIEPKDRTPEGVYLLLDKIYEDQGFDGVLIDPFKNVEQNIKVRDDIFLDQLFARFKEFAISKNISMNWIAHPKANVNRVRTVKGEECLMPCDQYMLNGGAAWNNSMDGVYSVFRPYLLEDIKSSGVNFINMKQRKQALVAERGTVTGIEFNIKTMRYLFNGMDYLQLSQL